MIVRRLLDPRTFPLAQIASFVHALPPPGIALNIADVPDPAFEQALRFLAATGRPYDLVPAPPEPQPTRLWDPSPGLLSVLDQLPIGTALDLGCGTGRDAVYLALQGWNVTGIDRLPDALARAKDLAHLHGVTATFTALDAERDPLPQGAFDLVTAFRYLPSLATMASALRPGGSLIVQTFTDHERARTGKPRDPRRVLPASGPPPLPPSLKLRQYEVALVEDREFATLWATLSPS